MTHVTHVVMCYCDPAHPGLACISWQTPAYLSLCPNPSLPHAPAGPGLPHHVHEDSDVLSEVGHLKSMADLAQERVGAGRVGKGWMRNWCGVGGFAVLPPDGKEGAGRQQAAASLHP